jgi:hypothetical protein
MSKIWVYLAIILVAVTCSFPLASRAQNPPRYKFDPSWPKDLPNNWILGHVEAVSVDKNDHIWVLNFSQNVPLDDVGAAQNPPLSECCFPAPQVLEFDTDGNLVKSWGVPGYVHDWPIALKSLYVDKEMHVWISGIWMGLIYIPDFHPPKNAPLDRQVLKFTSDGKQLMEIGHPTDPSVPVSNQDTTLLGGPFSILVDDDSHEVYIGEQVNKRIVVYDSNSGEFKRGWGAYGIPLSEIDNFVEPLYDPTKPQTHPQQHPYDPLAPPSKQFRGPVSLGLSADGLLYACDRGNDRIQVFTKQGKFVKEFFVAPKTIGIGSAQAVAFSHDPKQKYLLVADTATDIIRILNRDDGTQVGTIGHKGHYGGQFDMIDAIATDSHGNLYTTEVKYNNRIQKFILEK